MELSIRKSYVKKHALASEIIVAYKTCFRNASELLRTYEKNVSLGQVFGSDLEMYPSVADKLRYVKNESRNQMQIMESLRKSPFLYLKRESKMASKLQEVRREARILSLKKV